LPFNPGVPELGGKTGRQYVSIW